MKKLFAFDVDGTLADVYSNIQPGIQPLFRDKRIQNCGVTFITGNTITTIKKMRQNLQELTPYKLPINNYCASLGGAIVYDKSNQPIYKKKFCKRRLLSYMDMCVELEPKCFFMLMLEDKQIFCHVADKKTEDFIRSYFGRMNMDPNELSFAHGDYHTLVRKLPEIYTINIFNAQDSDALLDALSPKVKEKGYFIYIEKRINMMQISTSTKLKALKYISRQLKQNGEFDGSAKSIVFFGDGGNDITSMQYCGLSIARGTDLEQSVVDVSDIYTDDVSPYLDKIYQ